MANEVELHVSVHKRGNLTEIGNEIRRDYQRIGADVGRGFSKSFSRTVRNSFRGEGRSTGRGIARSIIEGFGEMTAAGARVAADFGNGIARALSSNPMVAAAVGAAILTGVASVLPLIGAGISGAVVTGLGAGLAGAGIAFAAQSAEIKAEWGKVFREIGQEMTEISEPFESTLLQTAGFIGRTFRALKPDLADAFDFLGPSVTKFLDAAGRGVENLKSSIRPLAAAFDAVLDSLGDQLPGMLADIADSITGVANSIKDNPETFVMLIGWLKNIITFSLDVAAGLNKVAGFFERIPGFGLAMGALGLALKMFLAPFMLVLDALAALGQIDEKDVLKIKKGMEANKKATDGAAKAMRNYADEIRAQLDPTFAFFRAQNQLTDAHKAYDDAVSKHGKTSREAREAQIRLAEAALRVKSAAIEAAKSGFDGSLTPATKRMLRQAGLTTSEIRDLERQLRRTKKAAEDYAKTYRARIITVFQTTGQRVSGVTGVGGHTKRSGGISGAQGGGPRGSFTLVGEEGPEIAELPFGTMVRSHSDTRRMLSEGGRGVQKVVLEVQRSGDAFLDTLVEMLAGHIRVKGGDVQLVLGQS